MHPCQNKISVIFSEITFIEAPKIYKIREAYDPQKVPYGIVIDKYIENFIHEKI